MSDLELTHALLAGEPYFGPAFLASSGVESAWGVARAIQSVEGERPLRILLLGCWLGACLPPLREALMARLPGSRVTCVDDLRAPADRRAFPSMQGPTWMEMLLGEARERGVLRMLLAHNLKAIGGEGLFCFHEQSAEAFLSARPGDSWDLVFIDAARVIPSFGSVFDGALAHLQPGGILCGTGYCHKPAAADAFGVDFGVRHGRRHLQSPSGQWFFPEVSRVLSGRFPDLAENGGVWALRRSSESWHLLELNPPERTVSVCGKVTEYVVYQHEGRYIVLHDSIPATALFSERLGEREIPGLVYIAENEDAAGDIAAEANDRIQRRKSCRIGQTDHYDLIRCGDRYVAMLRFVSASPLHLFEEQLGESDLPPTVLTGDTESEVRQKIVDQEATLGAIPQSIPVAENYMGYALYALPEGRWLAANHRVGEIRPFREVLGETEIYPEILRTENRELMLRRIRDIVKGRFQESGPELPGWR